MTFLLVFITSLASFVFLLSLPKICTWAVINVLGYLFDKHEDGFTITIGILSWIGVLLADAGFIGSIIFVSSFFLL